MSVYYDPFEFNLYPLAELELDDEAYQFNILCVWRHEDDRLFWGQDSGCSCPSPFEDFVTLDSLDELSRYDYPMIERIVRASSVHASLEAAYFLREVAAAIEML